MMTQKTTCGQVNSGTPCDLRRAGNDRVCPDCNPRALKIQQKREAENLSNHRQRLIWLENENPRWSCGTLVDKYSRRILILQSRAAIARATGGQ